MCRRGRGRYFAEVKLAAAKPQPLRRVLGIDPGTNVLGFAVVEGRGSARKLVTAGVLKTPPRESHAEKLRTIFERIVGLIGEHQPTECAIEAPFYGKNVQSMLKLGRAQGVAMAAAISRGLEVCEYAPSKIKQSVTGGGGASKEQVAELVARMLAFDRNGMPLDATDAVATALCHLNQRAFGAVGGESYAGWSQFLERNPGRVR